jgi:uncharacterized protein YyaL (SSP411 family)
MERESFEDEETAALLNERFVSIKVDREERPDIDSIYMNVCQMMNGHGGWPLSIFMTPEKVPFYAGTYFPKKARYGYPSFKDVIIGLSNKFREDPEHIIEVTDSVLEALKPQTKVDSDQKVSMKDVEKAFSQYHDSFDPRYGGFGQAPKFPMPHSLTFLLRYYKYSQEKTALNMVVQTLSGLARGGIYDHIGFGFSRYSVDEKFLIPHFEKMLYDNALLAIAYIEAYQITKEKPLKKVAEDIFHYILRDMQHHEGGFYCAEDADSEGEEGKFYVWTPTEIKDVLGEELGALYCDVYDITKSGNFEGKNIPNLIKFDFDRITARYGQDYTELSQKLEEARVKLLKHREQRVHPYKDDKILTSWNALMIAALAKGGAVFGVQDYILAAEKAILFIERNLIRNGRLMVRFRDGDVRNKGFIDDYAFLLWAYIELYEATFELGYIAKAKKLTEKMLDLFWDYEEGGFFFYGRDNEELLIRQKEAYDGAIPSGNSVAAMGMLRLARLTGDFQLEEKVQQLFDANAWELTQYPEGHAFLLQTYLMSQIGMKEVIVLKEKNASNIKPLIQELRTGFHPEVTFLVSDDIEKLARQATFTKDYHKIGQETTIYVCENFVCNQPTTNIEEAIELISKKR